MVINRRNFLKAGGAALIAVAGGTVYRAVDQGVFNAQQGPAYLPWTNWRASDKPTERIVGAAILAANPHNSQPWYFRISADAIDLYADYSRQIGVIDPLRREMHQGLGCAVENMALAARAEGFAGAIDLMPDSRFPEHVAHLALTPATAQVSEFYKAIPNRHTNRGPYDTTRALSPETVSALTALSDSDQVRLFWFTDEAAKRKFTTYEVAAAEALNADSQQSIDSHRWWRQGWADIQQNHDGLTVDGVTLDPLSNVAAKLLPDMPRSQFNQLFLQGIKDNATTASAYGLIAIRSRFDNAQRMLVGRLWQRMHLWATLNGLAMQPLNEMCERSDREFQRGIDPVFQRALRDLTGSDDWYGTMPFRTGYALRPASESPRRSVQEVVI